MFICIISILETGFLFRRKNFMILVPYYQNDALKLYLPRQCSRKIANLNTINTCI